MKKNGFVLVETLVATILIATVFTYIYLQFTNINENYRKTYENNTVEGLYGLNNIKSFILSDSIRNLKNSNNSYIDITECNMAVNSSQCINLINVLEIKKIIFMKDDIKSLKNELINDTSISDNFKTFIKIVNTKTVHDGYRLLVEYKNGTCATLKVEG